MTRQFSESDNFSPKNTACERGILGDRPNPEARIINDFEVLGRYVEALRTLNQRIVLTSGSFDLLHIGHAKYLEQAKSYGDILIVGVDSDDKVKKRKGPDRPVVPDEERTQILSHLRSVDIITVKPANEEKWALIKLVRPDTLIVTDETYSDEKLKELMTLCGQVISLEPQATTSTTAQIRRLQIGWTGKIIEPIERLLEEHGADEELKRKIGKILLGYKNE